MRRFLPTARWLCLAVLCLAAGYGLGLRQATSASASSLAALSAEDQRAFAVVWEALGQIERDYYAHATLDHQKLAQGAARGLVEAVGDPYTRLSVADPADPTAAELRGSFDGIGVRLDRQADKLLVASLLADSPAERAGLRTGDAILAIDDQDTSHLSLAEAVSRLRGPRQSQVTLTVERDDQRQMVRLTRDQVLLPSVEGYLLPGDGKLAYLRLSIFGEPTALQLHQNLQRLLAAGARGVILDLRGNPGGYLTSAVAVTSAFVHDGVVLYQQADGQATAVRTTGIPQAPDVPLAVLVDHGSASAAEIVAAALRDHGRALLVGQTTFGKGTVQDTRTLAEGTQLHISVAQWLTPNGQAVQGAGLQPDLEVASQDGRDAPLEAAVAYLSSNRLPAHG